MDLKQAQSNRQCTRFKARTDCINWKLPSQMSTVTAILTIPRSNEKTDFWMVRQQRSCDSWPVVFNNQELFSKKFIISICSRMLFFAELFRPLENKIYSTFKRESSDQYCIWTMLTQFFSDISSNAGNKRHKIFKRTTFTQMPKNNGSRHPPC